MSADRERDSSRGADGEGTSAWAVLHDLLVELSDASRAGALLSSALGASKADSPPTSVDAVLAFAEAHLLPFVRAAVGAPAAAAFMATLEAKLSATGHAVVQQSGRRRRDERDTMPAPSLTPPTPSVPPMRKRLPSISGDVRRPIALLVAANALERSALARALVQTGVDVRSIETTAALATMLAGEDVVRLAIVDLDRDDAPSVLAALAESRPGLAVVARTGGGAVDAARAAGLNVVYTYARRHPPADAIERIREYAMREDPAATPADHAASDASRADFARVPRLAVAFEDVGWFELDVDADVLVRNVDGEADLATTALRCGLAPDDALRIVRTLVERGILVFE